MDAHKSASLATSRVLSAGQQLEGGGVMGINHCQDSFQSAGFAHQRAGENGATLVMSCQLLEETSSSDLADGAAQGRAPSQVADASLCQPARDKLGARRDPAGALDQDELHSQECQQVGSDDCNSSCCLNNTNKHNDNNNSNNDKDHHRDITRAKRRAEIGSGASDRQNNGANTDERRRILNDTRSLARARDEEPDQAGPRRLDDLGADGAIDLGGASSRGVVQAAGRCANGDNHCDQDDISPVIESFPKPHGVALSTEELKRLVRQKIKSKKLAAQTSELLRREQKTMIEDVARYQVASHLDALSASLKLARDASEDETDLLNVLHRLGEWRAELRLVDNQLFELMSQCFSRLDSQSGDAKQKPAPNGDIAQVSQSGRVDLAPIDLTQANQSPPRASAEKRVKFPSSGINYKKIRLLGARADSPASNNDQPKLAAEQHEIPAIAAPQSGTITHRLDDSDDQSDEKPELRKFCSIGTAEISHEQFSRQQQMFDLTLAKLAKDSYKTEATRTVSFELTPTQDQPHELHRSQMQSDYLMPRVACHQSQKQSDSQVNYQNYECMNNLAMTTAASNQAFSYQTPIIVQGQSSKNQTDHYNLELSHMSIIQASGQCRQNNESLTYHHHQPQTLVTTSDIHLLDQMPHNHLHQQYQRHFMGKGSSAFDNLIRNSANICKDLVPIVRKMTFQCHVCQSCFEDRHRLQQHLSIHLNLHPSWFEEKTIKETMAQYELRRGDYLCHICKVRYETTSEFDKHMQLHGDKPHQCNLCTRDSKFVSFRYFRQLLTHLRSHCFLYSCKFVPECRQTANRKDYLKLHILKHHLNNKLPEQYTICCH